MWNVRAGDDWVSACKKCGGGGSEMCGFRGRKTWYECAKDVMKALGLHPEWAAFMDMWASFGRNV